MPIMSPIAMTLTACMVALAAAQPQHHQCTAPPALWCLSRQVAEACGVQHICDRQRDQPVKLTLMYESLCPGCHKFLLQSVYGQVYRVFNDSQVQIELVPFGNAAVHGSHITCQHGPDECTFNRLESCALHLLPIRPYGLPFVACVEQTIFPAGSPGTPDPLKVIQTCAKYGRIPAHYAQQIGQCFKGAMGQQLQLQAAARTANISPDKHMFVPWIVINDVSQTAVQQQQAHIVQFLCSLLLGRSDLPPQCKNTNATYSFA